MSTAELSSSLSFMPATSWAIAGLAAALALVGFLIVRRWAGAPPALSRRAGLFGLRAVTVLLVLGILANPVRVSESTGNIQRPEVFYLLDASRSMAMGDDSTRWQDAVGIIRQAHASLGDRGVAKVNMFQFGQRLSAIDSAAVIEADAELGSNPTSQQTSGGEGESSQENIGPVETDTRLVEALRQLPSRFGRSLPAAVVLFSDGRIRDPALAHEVAGYFQRLGAPISVVPVGNTTKGGDIAIVGVVAPSRARKFSQIDAHVFWRSFGYEGRRTEIQLTEVDERDGTTRKLASVPVTLSDGPQSASLSFRSGVDASRLTVTIPPLSDEVSNDNNTFSTALAIDRTKIRVLYMEGSPQRSYPTMQGGQQVVRGPYSELREALMEDPDIECVAVTVTLTGAMQRVVDTRFDNPNRGFPDTIAELSAYDAIILSGFARSYLSDEQLAWIEQWVNKRGAGLCMVGGPTSFASGNWSGTPLERILPVELAASGSDWDPSREVQLRPIASASDHPLWSIVSDEKQNQQIVQSIPGFVGHNASLRLKPNLATALAVDSVQASGSPDSLLAVGQYGKGRTMALATAITAPWAADVLKGWGDGDGRYYAKFWRNAIYWLTESSSIGRRRLIAGSDKRFYRTGESISLSALAFDESANRVNDYRVVAMLEPQMSAGASSGDYSPVRWPEGLARESGESGPFIAWGEEFELLPQKGPTQQEGYGMLLSVADTLTSGLAAEPMRVELTAYEGATQVDSTSMDIQVLHDPFEQQNPFPDHDVLRQIASISGGKTLPDAESLASMLDELPVKIGPPLQRREPLWDQWWLLALLLGLLTIDWLWRRRLGLA